MQSIARRFLLLLPLLLSLAAASRAQYGYVPIQQSHGANGSSCVFDQNVTSGDIIIASSNWESSTSTPTVSDLRSPSFSQAKYDSTDTPKVAIYIATATSSGSDTVTFSVSGASFQQVSCSEWPPVFSTTPDVTDAKFTSGTPATCSGNAVTTTLNNDILYAHAGGFQGGGQFTFGSGYTGVQFHNTSDSEAAEFKVAGANGSYTASFGNVTNTQCTVVTVALKSSSITIRSPAVLPDGALSNAYSYTLLATGGAGGAYTWSITSGVLQLGLSLNASTGAITGTPTSGANNSITFQVTDGTHTTTKAVTLKISVSLNAATVVQTKAAGGNADTGSLTFTSNVTAGDLLVAAGRYGGASANYVNVQYCTDTLGTNFQTVLNTDFYKVPFDGLGVYAGVAPSSGADTINCGGSGGGIRIAAELSNAQYFGNDNVVTTQSNTASPITSGTLTTLVPNEALFSFAETYTGGATITVSSPFTAVAGQNQNFAGGYRIVTTVTGYTVTYTTSGNTDGNWLIFMAGFRPSGGAAAPPPGGPARHQVQDY